MRKFTEPAVQFYSDEQFISARLEGPTLMVSTLEKSPSPRKMSKEDVSSHYKILSAKNKSAKIVIDRA